MFGDEAYLQCSKGTFRNLNVWSNDCKHDNLFFPYQLHRFLWGMNNFHAEKRMYMYNIY